MENTTKKLLLFLILPLGLLTTAVLIALFQARPDFQLHIKFYDNFTFIKTYQNHKIIMDGGPDDKILSQIGSDLPYFDRNIDVLILTKVDSKHVAGLVDVLKRYQVKMVLIPPSSANLSVYWEFLDLVKAKNVQKIFSKPGQRLWLDDKTVLDIYNIDSFSAKLSFGHTVVTFPDEQNHGEFVSDGSSLVPVYQHR